MKIYTKTGDAGQTGLFSGTRIAKYDLRLHAYGTLDELNSHLGLLRDQIPAEWDAVRAELAQVQSDLFALGSHMANDLPEMVARATREMSGGRGAGRGGAGSGPVRRRRVAPGLRGRSRAGAGGRRRPALDAELGEHVLEMPPDSVLADGQR